MIIQLLCDSGCFLSDKEVISIDAKRNFGGVMGIIREKLQLDSMNGYGMWIANTSTKPPIPWLPVDRKDTPNKLGLKQGDVLFIRKETTKERKDSITNTQILRDLKEKGEKREFAECIKMFSQIEATRQRAARRLIAMNLMGSEWAPLDPTTIPQSLDCPICRQPLAHKPADPVQLENCTHRFHETCLLAWIGTGSGLASTKCPICRTKIKAPGLDPFSSDEEDAVPLIRAT